jgi:hypothetical protein
MTTFILQDSGIFNESAYKLVTVFTNKVDSFLTDFDIDDEINSKYASEYFAIQTNLYSLKIACTHYDKLSDAVHLSQGDTILHEIYLIVDSLATILRDKELDKDDSMRALKALKTVQAINEKLTGINSLGSTLINSIFTQHMQTIVTDEKLMSHVTHGFMYRTLNGELFDKMQESDRKLSSKKVYRAYRSISAYKIRNNLEYMLLSRSKDCILLELLLNYANVGVEVASDWELTSLKYLDQISQLESNIIKELFPNG